jgi:hypothetical protein
MTTQFDFSSIADLGKFWDGGQNAANAGGGKFNAYSAGISNRSNNLDLLYQNLLGRNADSSGKKYWDEQIKSGATTYQGVADAIKASDEYVDQQEELAANPNATADDLRNLGTAYVDPFHWGSGSAFAGWSADTPSGGPKLTQAQAESATGGAYSDHKNKNVNQVVDHIFSNIGTGDNPFLGGGGGQQYQKYDDSGLRNTITGLTDQLSSLRTAFDDYKTQSASDMQNMWNNANWGWGYGSGVGGVRTQNELPGWAPKRGGTSGFFGRGGRSGKGLTTSSLNI